MSMPMMAMSVLPSLSLVTKREPAGNTTQTDPRSQRCSAPSRFGQGCAAGSSSPTVRSGRCKTYPQRTSSPILSDIVVRRLANPARMALWNGPPLYPAAYADRANKRGKSMTMQIAVLGIYLGKNSCSVVGLDRTGKVVLRRRLHRESVIKLASSLAPCVMALEACCGAHHLGRILRDQGHDIRLMSAEYVRPYVKSQKNDDWDAEAIAEAATRPTMRFVELKSSRQLDVQSLHRVRDCLVGERTALLNQVRAGLLERGIT